MKILKSFFIYGAAAMNVLSIIRYMLEDEKVVYAILSAICAFILIYSRILAEED